MKKHRIEIIEISGKWYRVEYFPGGHIETPIKKNKERKKSALKAKNPTNPINITSNNI